MALQLLVEISTESGVIYATGNIYSPFAALYVLTIVSAAQTYRMVGTRVVASLVSAAYGFIIWFGLSSPGDAAFSMQALRTIFSANESVFYAIFMHILIFYLTAFMSGYLAERLSNQGRQLADTSLALKRALLETDDILRHLNSGLLTIDAGGDIIYFNRAAERVLGYSEERVRGMPCHDVFAERMPELAECLLDGTTIRKAYPRRELQIDTGGNGIIPLGLSTSILTEEGGTLRGVIAIFSDLTEAKQLEAKARVNDRLAAIGELSASIAHEIRNPLTAISGSVEVLQRELQLTNENGRLMELIVKESQRLNKILSDFLGYARISRPTYNKVELCRIISDVQELMRRGETSGHIELEFESDDSFVYVVGDDDLIRQLVMNVTLNACESLRGRQGRVGFRVVRHTSREIVDLQIHDNGPGIAPENLERIYEPFYSTKKSGTGLGLAVVHRICTALKLKLHVDTDPNQGTTFIIRFKAYGQDPPSVPKIGESHLRGQEVIG